MAHLLRRAGFGGSAAEIDALVALPSWAAVVDRVLDTSANPPETTPSALAADAADPYYPAWVAGVQYWMDRMATSPTPLVEKLALFWHGILTSSSDDSLPRAVFQQIRTYRALGLGDVHDLLQAAAVEPAMLYYLNGASNVKAQPNENFARELMELFTLGNGAFAESDVIAMAKAWTGHNVNAKGDAYQFFADRHDTSTKTLFGISRNWDGPEALTEIVRGSKQAVCARYLAGRLWSFFAYPNPAPALLDELAAAFVAGGMQVRAFLRVVFLRPEFRLATTRTALVRSPIEWLVATMRAAGMTAGAAHPEWWMERLGQTLYQPPNVSGWRQNGAWISSSAQWGKGDYAGWIRWKANEAGIFADLATPGTTPAAAAQAAFDRFGIDEPSPLTRRRLEEFVLREQTANRRWTIPPNLFALTMLTPDFQLA